MNSKKVSDLGQHRTLTKETKAAIRRAYLTRYMSLIGAPVDTLVDQLLQYTLGLLEPPEHCSNDWYEK